MKKQLKFLTCYSCFLLLFVVFIFTFFKEPTKDFFLFYTNFQVKQLLFLFIIPSLISAFLSSLYNTHSVIQIAKSILQLIFLQVLIYCTFITLYIIYQYIVFFILNYTNSLIDIPNLELFLACFRLILYLISFNLFLKDLLTLWEIQNLNESLIRTFFLFNNLLLIGFTFSGFII